MANRLETFVASIVLLGCVSCDQVTKQIAVEHLAGRPPRHHWGGLLTIRYEENTGAFLGLGAEWPESLRLAVFVVCTALALAAVSWVLVRRCPVSGAARLGLLLVLAGGLGNLVDRVRLGHVVDFLNVGVGRVRTGIFNVADMAIMAGAVLLLCAPSFAAERPRPAVPGDGA